MHHSYIDIIGPMTALLRRAHLAEKEAQDSDGPSADCLDEIDPDSGLCSCVAKPLWWDSNGVPRFVDHHPDLCADIYANEIVLMVVACQACAREFPVQLSVGLMDLIYASKREEATLEALIRADIIHYGDPPHVECCPAGPTMNVLDLRIVEFWRRATDSTWSRVAELEIDLGDAYEARGEPRPQNLLSAEISPRSTP
jgi:hypothetical protein